MDGNERGLRLGSVHLQECVCETVSVHTAYHAGCTKVRPSQLHRTNGGSAVRGAVSVKFFPSGREKQARVVRVRLAGRGPAWRGGESGGLGEPLILLGVHVAGLQPLMAAPGLLPCFCISLKHEGCTPPLA